MNVINSNAISQSYLNEYKGNLLEYLVARRLSSFYGFENDFIHSLDSSLRERLSLYEIELRKKDPFLLQRLPAMASEIGNVLYKEISSDIKKIEVVGKMARYKEFKEADILIHGPKVIPISLKLCKTNCYINTKSGGIRSFFSNYFKSFEESFEDQNKLNRQVQMLFSKMSHDLYESAGLTYKGQFDQDLLECIGTELPGQLESPYKEIVHDYYYGVMKEFYQLVEKYYFLNKKMFIDCLYPIMGFGKSSIWQLSALYKNKYDLEKILLKKNNLINSDQIKLAPFEKNKSFLSFQIEKDILQLRLKPMNKFTVSGLKVNCSLKYGA